MYFSTQSFTQPFAVKSAQTILKPLYATETTKLDNVTFWRLIFSTALATIIYYQHYIDARLVKLWSFLLESDHLTARLFRADSFEWCLAVTCFAFYLFIYCHVDRAVHMADLRGKVHPWKKYRLQDRYQADMRRRNMNKPVSIDDSNDDAITTQSDWNWSVLTGELWVYVLPLFILDTYIPRRYNRIIQFAAPTTIQILREIVTGLLAYDFMFFLGHYTMHKVPFLYRNVHKKHHSIKEVRAAEIVRLSILEEVVEVGFSIVALQYLHIHPIARSLYNVVITFLLTELHCGFDFAWTPQNVIPFGIVTGSRRHHYHHRNGKHYYQKFFFTLDYIFGHYQEDDGSLHGDSVKANPYIPSNWL